jgi:hypothetical protein
MCVPKARFDSIGDFEAIENSLYWDRIVSRHTANQLVGTGAPGRAM